MNKSAPKISLEEKKKLKENNRLELVMQESGERFEVDSKDKNLWRSLVTPGLLVNIRRQSYELAMPGKEAEGGDVFTWLMWRNGWTFPQALRYLQHRPQDPNQETQSAKTEINIMPASYRAGEYISDHPDKEKEKSGLYEKCTISQGNSISYRYLLKPSDHWQERALEIGGERMRGYFYFSSEKIEDLQRVQYKRFIPIQDVRVRVCDECEEEIDLRVYVYLVDGEDDFIICEKCKQDYVNFYLALGLLYTSAYKREAPKRERLRLEEIESARREWEREEAEEREYENQAEEAFREAMAEAEMTVIAARAGNAE